MSSSLKMGTASAIRRSCGSQLRPSDKKKRKAAVCVLAEGRGVSLLYGACWFGRLDMAAALPGA